MKTDDFLADLERQLASARPRRRPPAVTWLAVPAVAAILVVAFLAGGDPGTEREARPATTGSAVIVENRTGDPAVGAQAGDKLAAAGYDVTVRDLPGVPETAIFAPEPDAQRIAEVLGLESIQEALGWTAYAPLGEGPVRVVLGKNELGGGVEPILVLDASGRPGVAHDAQEHLESAGGLIVGGSGGSLPAQKTQVLAIDPSYDVVAKRVRDALGLPPAPPRYASQELLDEYVGEPPGGVIVIVGTDYER